MPVYNGESFLNESIKSILDQTFKDFEFIIVNDGSTDKSHSILRSINDPRIIVHEQRNKGLPFSLNKAIRLSQGEYIARMDADDISMPNRLEIQKAFLDSMIRTNTQMNTTIPGMVGHKNVENEKEKKAYQDFAWLLKG